MNQMNAAGFALLRLHEGLVLYAYDDADPERGPIEPGESWRGTLTIGYGHTGADVRPGLVWTQEQAEDALSRDVGMFSSRLLPLIAPAELDDDRFSALVCFAYNIGLGGFERSTAREMVVADRLIDVPDDIMRWDKVTVDGRIEVSQGLIVRRRAEVELWNGGDRAALA